MPSNPGPTPPPARDSRALVRFLGATTVTTGIVLTAIGTISLLSSGRAIGGAHYFWAAFLGLPLIAIGSALGRPENLGPYRRDRSGEMMPVANWTAPEQEDATREMPAVECGECQAVNPADARFCHHCGASIVGGRCPGCGAKLVPRARFCNQCGQAIA